MPIPARTQPASGSTTITDFSVTGTSVKIVDDDERGVRLSTTSLTVAEGNEERLGDDIVPLAAAAVDDYPIRCKRDVAGHDLLRWGALVEADAPAEDRGLDAGAQRFVRFEGVLIGRTPGRTEKEDRCTVDVRWRSDGGPCGETAVPLGALMAGGCSRAFTDDEQERRERAEKQQWKLDRDRKAVLKQELEQKQRQELKQELEQEHRQKPKQGLRQEHQQEHTQGIHWRMRLW